MSVVARLAAGRRTKWVVIAIWLVAAVLAFPFESKLQVLASDESDAFKDRNAESTQVEDRVERDFKGGNEVTTLVLYTRDGAMTPEDQERMAADASVICNPLTIEDVVRVYAPERIGCGEFPPPISVPQSSNIKPSTEDQTTVLMTVWTTDDSTEALSKNVEAIRKIVPKPTDEGLRAYVLGEGGFTADQSAALEGINETLLIATLILVLVLLLLIYRSPVIAIVPLVVVGIAYIVAAAVVYAAAQQELFAATGQATAILIVLMFGAGTDYCLLLLSRYREELATDQTPSEAMRTALTRTGPAIVSAGGIVIVVMLVLGLAGYNATRWMGPVLAIGMAITVLAGITLLPALLSVVGMKARRRKEDTVWPRIGALVKARPALLTVLALAFLTAGALGNLKDTGTLDFSEEFRNPPESVAGLRHMEEKFPPGQAGPVDLVLDALPLASTMPALLTYPNVFSVDQVAFSAPVSDKSLVRLTFNDDPFSDASAQAIPAIREYVREAGKGSLALVGGPTAEIYDSEQALRSDARLIVPLALALVFLIVAILLRSLIAPLYVIATVLLSYAFALGVSALVFDESNPAMPLFTFVFLVALGVDYNVFLLTRIREERDVIKGLERTGGVITSAGLILAGTFLTLLATELESLYQVGFTVALGLLVDTFLIRIFLVPSIALMLGRWNWWPSHRRLGSEEL